MQCLGVRQFRLCGLQGSRRLFQCLSRRFMQGLGFCQFSLCGFERSSGFLEGFGCRFLKGFGFCQLSLCRLKGSSSLFLLLGEIGKLGFRFRQRRLCRCQIFIQRIFLAGHDNAENQCNHKKNTKNQCKFVFHGCASVFFYYFITICTKRPCFHPLRYSVCLFFPCLHSHSFFCPVIPEHRYSHPAAASFQTRSGMADAGAALLGCAACCIGSHAPSP